LCSAVLINDSKLFEFLIPLTFAIGFDKASLYIRSLILQRVLHEVFSRVFVHIYIYRLLGGRCHSRLYIDSNKTEEENEVKPPILPYFTVDKSVLRMNITITFVPMQIFEYYISLFQHNTNIDILRLRTDARPFSEASHGGSTHTEDMHVRLSESYWEATISSKYFN